MTEFRFNCPKCSRQIQCDISYSGTPINCPGCNQPIVVPTLTKAAATSAAVPCMPGRKIVFAAGLVILLAGLFSGGWLVFGFIKARQLRGNLPPGLVAYWAFEGNGRDSAGHNTLTTGGNGEMSYDEGRVGKSMSQAGNNHAFELPGVAGIDFNKDFTLSVWLYRDGSIYDNDAVFENGSIYLAKRDAEPWNSRMGVYITSSDKRSLQLVDNSSMGQPPLHQWFHVLVYRKDNTMGIKVNNSGTATVDVSDMRFQSASTTYIGQQQAGYPWQGRIDEFCLWNRALTPDEISALYDAAKVGRR